MTRFHILAALTAVLLLPALAVAEDSTATDELAWDQFDDPSFDPVAATESAASDAPDEPSEQEIFDSVSGAPAADQARPDIQLGSSAAGTAPTTSRGVRLGPLGVDDLGRAGRLHTVATGDTLWDLAAAYLGTPWVWPSVWIDNDDIENPHRIDPGDKIWITANEMRVVTDAEAASFISSAADAGLSRDDADLEMDDEGSMPVAALETGADDLGAMDEASTLDAFPLTVEGTPVRSSASGRRITVARRESMGFVSPEEFEGSSSIVGSPLERIYLSTGDEVVLGVGEGDVEVGDHFSVFTVIEEVRDAETLRLLGHHVDSLGWVEVTELTGDTSIAIIRTTFSEIERGARVVRRDPPPTTVEVRTTPDVIEGKVAYLPSDRTMMADGGYVYLNRGEFHGVEVGSELEVFEPGVIMDEPARDVDVQTPDQIVASIVVVTVKEDSSVGFVLWSKRELEVGDVIRATVPTLAQR